MRRACRQQIGRSGDSVGVNQRNQRTPACFHRRQNGRDEAAVPFGGVTHVHDGDLRITVQEALRDIRRPPRGDDAPTDLARGLGQSIAISRRENE